MGKKLKSTAATRGRSVFASLTVGVPLALLWAVHAAAPGLPGARVLLLPFLLVMACGLLLWRRSLGLRTSATGNSGVTAGLGCWFVAATLSAILNWDTPEVLLTYVSVFVSGAAIFVALAGFTCTSDDLEAAVCGLAIGALLPLVAGLMAFGTEWGTPDVTTTISAWQNLARMVTYENATFGNRGNTAGFLLIVTPMLFAVVLDGARRIVVRVLCGATLIVVALNMMILQIRASIVVMLAALVIVSLFKLGKRRLPVLLGVLVLGGLVLSGSEAGYLMADRMLPVITVDTEADESILGRADAIKEGLTIASRNWLLGIGPGGALSVHSRTSAHQFQVQQLMETGILGLLGSTLLAVGVLVSLFRTVARGRGDRLNDMRFMLLIGPAAYVTYAVMANAALNNANMNTWTVLLASMLALAPRFERAERRAPVRTLVERPRLLRTREKALAPVLTR